MPNKGSDESKRKHGLGARRIPGQAHTTRSVPTTESKNESGERRLYAPVGSARSTSTLESGPRRLYISPAVKGQHAVVRRVVKPSQ